jgi:hypothetical protein
VTRQEYREYMAEYRAENRENFPEKVYGSSAWARLHPERALFLRMRENARKQSFKFVLTYQEFLDEIGGSIPLVCPVLGIILARGMDGLTYNSPSVDRINSSLPYIKGNIAVVSYKANMIKSIGTAAEHRAIADWIDERTGATGGVRLKRTPVRKSGRRRSVKQQGAA